MLLKFLGFLMDLALILGLAWIAYHSYEVKTEVPEVKVDWSGAWCAHEANTGEPIFQKR